MENEKHYNLVPSIGGSFSYAWRKIFDKSFLPLLLAVIIVGILNGPNYTWKTDGDLGMGFLLLFPAIVFGLAYALLFLPIVKWGEKFMFLSAMRDEKPDLKQLFEGFRSNYLNIVLANLIMWALIGLGLVMLIIPGIIIACRLAFVPYLVVDKNLDPMQAVERSWQLTKGHGWKVFWMAIISFFIGIAGLIVFFVGVIVSIMWIHGAFATLYQSVINEKEEENPIPILGVNEA
ncbi:MAG TPA: hypothetical protein VKA10_06275 [Prolixibacteraceae bacterium]|nr:hypothetical protein [Prolixibacteraceae bacterium]